MSKTLKKQEEDQALPTSFTTNNVLRKMEQEQVAPAESVVKDQAAIASLKTSTGWKLVEKMIEEQASSLKAFEGVPIDSMTDEEIGKRFLIANFAAEKLLGIINYVNGYASGNRAAEGLVPKED